ncbi:hypothetical protein HPP92_007627 [Vanilla planifolia]|uniref:Uncharacterized protein n=1 Tax=Vanilla planifolia TaxID=51239 RepID=A0A835V7W1_VANPL|nr:hypothetical protein HPP92_007627 [Vanilla planifolia]
MGIAIELQGAFAKAPLTCSCNASNMRSLVVQRMNLDLILEPCLLSTKGRMEEQNVKHKGWFKGIIKDGPLIIKKHPMRIGKGNRVDEDLISTADSLSDDFLMNHYFWYGCRNRPGCLGSGGGEEEKGGEEEGRAVLVRRHGFVGEERLMESQKGEEEVGFK